MKDFIETLNEEQKKALLEALSSDDKIAQQKKTREVNADFIVQTRTNSDTLNSKRREPVRGRENRWEDTGEFRDIETPEVERTPRRRSAPKKIDIECASCGKSFKVDSRFVYGEYYRCNRCGSKR
jgi:formylmethanofuran dehydrogenase subunit E